MKNKNTKVQGFKSLIVLTVLCISMSSFSQEKIWTLQECVSHALEYNISVK